jgi:membrane associated rhomboid family serine protease
MFLPLEKKPDWADPPVVTLLLILINVIIFYTWQHADARYEEDAFNYYVQSGLVKTELRAYLDYKKQPDRLSARDIETGSPTAQVVLDEMLKDSEFQRQLEQNRVIKSGTIGFDNWRLTRNTFVRMRERSVTESFGLDPSKPDLVTIFANMFLHGSDGHVWGNMVMLLLLGFGVEMILGRWLYLAGYLLAGIGGSLAYVAFYHDSTVHTVGASGAISGVLGMSVMIYGLRKINFFYFLFIYFDYIRARAIWIIPLYILSQAIIAFAFDTNINVFAHLGGFFTGLLFVGVLKLIPNTFSVSDIDDSQKEQALEKSISQARNHIAALQFDEARKILDKLMQSHPDDIAVTQLRFAIAKYSPATEEFHQLAHQLLSLRGTDKATAIIIHDTFTEYASKAKPKPRWTPDLMIDLITRFVTNGFVSDAEKLMASLLTNLRSFARNAEGVRALARYYVGKDKQKAQYYQSLLAELSPPEQTSTR